MKEKNFYERLGTSFELFFALNYDSQTSELKICVNNNPHSLGPILGKLIEPAYQQGSNPTVPTVGISTSFTRILRHVYVYKFMTFALIM